MAISGGVSANKTLRKMIEKNFPQEKIYFPERKLATDNGLNIAISGYFLYKNDFSTLDYKDIEVYPRTT
jgi:tRNA A37 threonylcarbamoyltransferase TsaD